MLASWPGIGNVSLTAGRYLVEKLGAAEIGEIDPLDFFELAGVLVRDNVVESPRFPENKFYYWRSSRGEKELLIFIGEQQPTFKGYELVNCVLDVAQKFKVTRIYSCAAAVTRNYNIEESKVWGVATTAQLVKELSRENVVLRGNLRIAGLNGLIMGMAKDRGIEGICLLGEVPTYATQIANPRASLTVLTVLNKMLGIEVDLSELRQWAEQMDEELEKLRKRATAEYIDQFTEPIWEREEEE
jgi:proteasome assembly chaperone (PAC2) family protein